MRERVKQFLNDTGATVNAFCKHVNISQSWYYRWMHEEIDFSEDIYNRITEYLNEVYAK